MKPLLEIRDLVRNYTQGEEVIPVLKGLDLDVNHKETIAIVGHSGTGKSTLLSLMAGLDKADGGSISINGTDIVTLGQRELTAFRAKTLSIIFQQFHLMNHLTAEENIALPLEILGRPVDDLPLKALETVGLAHRAAHKPGQMSGGEKQRVAIARAFIVKPKLLLADEPSGNLDDETGQKVMNQLFSLVEQANMTMILVTHNRGLASQCHKKFQLHGGKLQEI